MGKPKVDKTSPKLNVRQRKEKLEEKCRLARKAKENKSNKKNQSKESDNMSMRDFMEELRGRFESQDKKLDRNQGKMDLLSLKLEKIEENVKKVEKDNKDEMTKLRTDLNEGLTEIETKVSENVANELKPKMKDIQQQARVYIGEAVQREIKSIDIPKSIHNEVQVAIKKAEVSGKDDETSSDKVDIPALIKEEVLAAVKGLQKE